MNLIVLFALAFAIVYFFKSKAEKKEKELDNKRIQAENAKRQKELAKGRAIKKYLEEEEELNRYRRGDYSDPEEDDFDEYFDEEDEE